MMQIKFMWYERRSTWHLLNRILHKFFEWPALIMIISTDTMEGNHKESVAEQYEIQIRDLNKEIPPSYETTTENEREMLHETS